MHFSSMYLWKTRLAVKMEFKLAATLLCSGVLFCSVNGAAMDESDSNVIGREAEARNILSTLASNLMNRGFSTTGAGSSQVISLNLTNLLVLVLLKALIFAAGSLGAGTWKGGYARSLDGEEKFLSDEEILMFLSYLSGSPGCLQNISCQEPHQAKKYIAAGEMLLKMSKIFPLNADVTYEYVIQEMEQAANVGLAGGSCSRFECNNNRV